MSKQLIGYISVDSGTIMVSDPCYWIDGDTSWEQFCEEMGTKKVHNFNHKKAIGKGTAVSCDDGLYDVYLDFDEDTGRKQIIIEL